MNAAAHVVKVIAIKIKKRAFQMDNNKKRKLKHQTKSKDENIIDRLRKYVIRSRGNDNKQVRHELLRKKGDWH